METLIQVTALFAQRAAEFSTQVERDENGRFAVSRDEILARGPEVYENVAREYPFLALEGQTAAKPIFFSRLQSRLGFTGVYFPFTGEANVNVDAPVCLLPATVAHEMAHQRMVASEQEANFVGILAAVTSGDPVYQYSGYLMGLIQLCNALAPVDRAAWQDIVQRYFTQELACLLYTSGSHRPRRSCRSHWRNRRTGSHRPDRTGWPCGAPRSDWPYWPCRACYLGASHCSGGRCYRNGGCSHPVQPTAGEYAGSPSAGHLMDTA